MLLDCRRTALLVTISASLAGPACAPAAAVKKIEAGPFDSVTSQGFHSDVHMTRARHVVFARESITLANHATVALETNFDLSDPIYMRIFFDESPGNLFRKSGLQCEEPGEQAERAFFVRVKVQIADAPEDEWLSPAPVYFSRRDFDQLTNITFFPGSINGSEDQPPSVVTSDEQVMQVFFGGTIVPRLAPGEHTLSVHATAHCALARTEQARIEHDQSLPVASGSFQLTVESEEAKAAYWSARGPLLPQSRHRDQRKISLMANRELIRRWPGESLVKVIVTSSDYEIQHDEANRRPLARHVDAFVLTKNEQTGMCNLHDVALTQDYAGGSKYDEDLVKAVGRATHGYPCWEE
ncbi:MAG: hypothetical protein H0U74_20520 [Bradymonadaceae bacterium]|nr:hypothetical protein [Lujinxingiaceae bacterium]